MGSRVSSLEDAYFMNSTRMCIASFDAYGVAFEHHASSGRACVPTRVDRSAQRTLTWHRIRSIGRGGFEEYAEDPACCLLDGYTRFLLNAELRENSMLLIRNTDDLERMPRQGISIFWAQRGPASRHPKPHIKFRLPAAIPLDVNVV
jgi:hypothetical protein